MALAPNALFRSDMTMLEPPQNRLSPSQIWPMENPVGTEQVRPQYLTAPDADVVPGVMWGDRMTSPRVASLFQGASDNALNWVGTFGGPAAKTADMAKLSLAMRLETEGIGRTGIWKQTGWYKGPDGNWRFEIPDEGMKLTDKTGGASTLGSAVEHPELFAAYPELRQTELYRNAQFGGGRFTHGSDGLPPAITLGASKNLEPTLLHEIQHNVQAIEGNVGGASPSYVAAHPDTRAAFFQKYRELADNVTTPMSYEDYATAAWGGETSAASKADYLDNYLKTVPKSVPLYSPLDKTIQETAARDVYRRVFGEVEARSVPKRLGMTPQAKSVTGPWWNWDIPENQFILKSRK